MSGCKRCKEGTCRDPWHFDGLPKDKAVRCNECEWEGFESSLYQDIRDVDDYDSGLCPSCHSEEIEER
jgi:hypothetical protein